MLKIIRVINLPSGHLLLLGTGGAGRSSLTHIATFISQMELFTLKQSEDWREQVKKIMYASGVENKKEIFFIKESQLREEQIMEDISHILNNGEVPDLYTKEEKAKNIEEMNN